MGEAPTETRRPCLCGPSLELRTVPNRVVDIPNMEWTLSTREAVALPSSYYLASRLGQPRGAHSLFPDSLDPGA